MFFEEFLNFGSSKWFELMPGNYTVLLLNQSKFPGSSGHPLAV